MSKGFKKNPKRHGLNGKTIPNQRDFNHPTFGDVPKAFSFINLRDFDSIPHDVLDGVKTGEVNLDKLDMDMQNSVSRELFVEAMKMGLSREEYIQYRDWVGELVKEYRIDKNRFMGSLNEPVSFVYKGVEVRETGSNTGKWRWGKEPSWRIQGNDFDAITKKFKQIREENKPNPLANIKYFDVFSWKDGNVRKVVNSNGQQTGIAIPIPVVRKNKNGVYTEQFTYVPLQGVGTSFNYLMNEDIFELLNRVSQTTSKMNVMKGFDNEMIESFQKFNERSRKRSVARREKDKKRGVTSRTNDRSIRNRVLEKVIIEILLDGKGIEELPKRMKQEEFGEELPPIEISNGIMIHGGQIQLGQNKKERKRIAQGLTLHEIGHSLFTFDAPQLQPPEFQEMRKKGGEYAKLVGEIININEDGRLTRNFIRMGRNPREMAKNFMTTYYRVQNVNGGGTANTFMQMLSELKGVEVKMPDGTIKKRFVKHGDFCDDIQIPKSMMTLMSQFNIALPSERLQEFILSGFYGPDYLDDRKKSLKAYENMQKGKKLNKKNKALADKYALALDQATHSSLWKFWFQYDVNYDDSKYMLGKDANEDWQEKAMPDGWLASDYLEEALQSPSTYASYTPLQGLVHKLLVDYGYADQVNPKDPKQDLQQQGQQQQQGVGQPQQGQQQQQGEGQQGQQQQGGEQSGQQGEQGGQQGEGQQGEQGEQAQGEGEGKGGEGEGSEGDQQSGEQGEGAGDGGDGEGEGDGQEGESGQGDMPGGEGESQPGSGEGAGQGEGEGGEGSGQGEGQGQAGEGQGQGQGGQGQGQSGTPSGQGQGGSGGKTLNNAHSDPNAPLDLDGGKDLNGENDKGQGKAGKNHCFLSGTIVQTPFGNVPIEKLNCGDSIYAVHPDTKEVVETTITHQFVGKSPKYLVIDTDTKGQVKVTPEHPFWTGNAWKHIREFKVGDKLHTRDGTEKITSIVEIEKEVDIFHPTVEHSLHTFIANDFVVHNKSVGGGEVNPDDGSISPFDTNVQDDGSIVIDNWDSEYVMSDMGNDKTGASIGKGVGGDIDKAGMTDKGEAKKNAKHGDGRRTNGKSAPGYGTDVMDKVYGEIAKETGKEMQERAEKGESGQMGEYNIADFMEENDQNIDGTPKVQDYGGGKGGGGGVSGKKRNKYVQDIKVKIMKDKAREVEFSRRVPFMGELQSERSVDITLSSKEKTQSKKIARNILNKINRTLEEELSGRYRRGSKILSGRTSEVITSPRTARPFTKNIYRQKALPPVNFWFLIDSSGSISYNDYRDEVATVKMLQKAIKIVHKEIGPEMFPVQVIPIIFGGGLGTRNNKRHYIAAIDTKSKNCLRGSGGTPTGSALEQIQARQKAILKQMKGIKEPKTHNLMFVLTDGEPGYSEMNTLARVKEEMDFSKKWKFIPLFLHKSEDDDIVQSSFKEIFPTMKVMSTENASNFVSKSVIKHINDGMKKQRRRSG